MNEFEDAKTVAASMQSAITGDPHTGVTIHEAWADTPQSACVIYEYIQWEVGILGRRITFPPHAVEGDPTSTGADWAQTMNEPLGALADSLNKDTFGISWVGGMKSPFPVPPHWRPSTYKESVPAT
jgi:hypothetical protein